MFKLSKIKIFYLITFLLISTYHSFTLKPEKGLLQVNPLSDLMSMQPIYDSSKVLEIKTYVNGEIDLSDDINITTEVIDHINKEKFYITPELDNIDGKFNYKHHFMQKNNNETYSLEGDIKSEVKGKGNSGLHMQNIDMANPTDDSIVFKRYSTYLKKYLEYLYKNNVEIDPLHLKHLQNQFIFYGTNSNGTDPTIKSSFKIDKNKLLNTKTKNFDSLGGSISPHNNNISYGVTNLNANKGANSFQNVIANASGKDPKSGIKLQTNENHDYVRANINGQAIANDSDIGGVSWVDAKGSNEKFGFADNLSFADQEGDKLISIGEINGLSVDDGIVDSEIKKEKENYYANKPQNDIDKEKYLKEKEFLSNLNKDVSNISSPQNLAMKELPSEFMVSSKKPEIKSVDIYVPVISNNVSENNDKEVNLKNLIDSHENDEEEEEEEDFKINLNSISNDIYIPKKLHRPDKRVYYTPINRPKKPMSYNISRPPMNICDLPNKPYFCN